MKSTPVLAERPPRKYSSVPSPVPIGRAIANTQVHLLDSELRHLPLGVPGELCAAGDGLARGYFRRPALTAAVLVPDPYSPTPGGRLYKTGDLARHLPDGTLEFLGRRDHQVKFRGFRIELNEITLALFGFCLKRCNCGFNCVVHSRDSRPLLQPLTENIFEEKIVGKN